MKQKIWKHTLTYRSKLWLILYYMFQTWMDQIHCNFIHKVINVGVIMIGISTINTITITITAVIYVSDSIIFTGYKWYEYGFVSECWKLITETDLMYARFLLKDGWEEMDFDKRQRECNMKWRWQSYNILYTNQYNNKSRIV